MNYQQYCKQKANNFVQVQDRFKETYKTDSFENCFYDSELELLRLYNNDKEEIYFKYIPIGSYSLKLKTWMWSWYNNFFIENSKKKLLIIKEFGDFNNYGKLRKGTFSSERYRGWELAAICLDFFNAIGVYKINTDDLDTYFLIMEVATERSPEVKRFKQKKVTCQSHGYSRPALVCRHLNLDTPKGFEEAFETYKGMKLNDKVNFKAWCSECEMIRIQSEKEKLDLLTLICEDCYFELKDINQIKYTQ